MDQHFVTGYQDQDIRISYKRLDLEREHIISIYLPNECLVEINREVETVISMLVW